MGEDGSKPAIGHKYTSEHERSDIELYSRFVCSVCIVLYDIAYRILYFTSTCAVIIKNKTLFDNTAKDEALQVILVTN